MTIDVDTTAIMKIQPFGIHFLKENYNKITINHNNKYL